MTKLVGLTWDHPRAIDGLRAITASYLRDRPGLEIEWIVRSLRKFESASIEEVSRSYDMVVLDHPCVGEAAASGCLVDFQRHAGRLDLDGLKADTVGRSFDSYVYRGCMWALPIDATTQFSAYRVGALADDELPADIDGVLALGRRSGIALALKGIHSLMTFWSLCAVHGDPVGRETDDRLVSRKAASAAFETLRELYALCPPQAIGWDPIDVHETLAHADGPDYCPYLYGYVPYARADAAGPLRFGNAPGRKRGVALAGTIIGGTGLAISSSCKAIDEAVAFAGAVTSRNVQLAMGLAGGQPARRSAWGDATLNRRFSDFYGGALPTMESGIVRPRYSGYIQFQERAGAIAEACVAGRTAIADAVDALEAAHRDMSKGRTA